MVLCIVALVICAYIVGSIPTGMIIARIWGVRDIRQHGSGTMGATNVARVLGKKFFLPIFLLDAGKAWLYLFLVQKHVHTLCDVSPWLLSACAIALTIGNGCSLFLAFGPSGKGIATIVGILAALCPFVLTPLLLIWLSILIITRRVGIASVIALCVLPFVAWYINLSSPLLFLTIFVACWSLWLHRGHIRTMLNYQGL